MCGKMLLDINTSTSRQLTSLPGIDRKLADNITKYRHEKGKFLHIDDLWRVSGMNRPRFQLIKRHFKVMSEQKAIVSPKLTLARLPLTSSMVDFVCKGQSVANDQIKAKLATSFRPTFNIPYCEGVKPGATRAGKRYRLPSDTESKTRNTRNSRELRPKTVSREKPLVHTPSTDAKRTKTDNCSRCKTGSTRGKPAGTGDSEAACPHGAGSSAKPAFTLNTSPSGNNINFTCTIDKRLLGHPTSLAFKFDQNLISNKRENTPTPGKFVDVGRLDGGGEKEDSRDADDSSSEEYITAVCHPTAPLQHFVNQELPSIEGIKQGDSSSSLTEENVMMNERKNTPKPGQKKRSIEAWVDNVNEARNVGKLLKGRCREAPARALHSKLLKEEKARQTMIQPGTSRGRDPAEISIAEMLYEKDYRRGRERARSGYRAREEIPSPNRERRAADRKPPTGPPKKVMRDTYLAVPANSPRDAKVTPELSPVNPRDVSEALNKNKKSQLVREISASSSDTSSSAQSAPRRPHVSQEERLDYVRQQRRVIERQPRKHNRNTHTNIKRYLAPPGKTHRSESDVQATAADAQRINADGEHEHKKKVTHPSRKYHHDSKRRHGYDRYGKRHQRYSKREEEACKVM